MSTLPSTKTQLTRSSLTTTNNSKKPAAYINLKNLVKGEAVFPLKLGNSSGVALFDNGSEQAQRLIQYAQKAKMECSEQQSK